MEQSFNSNLSIQVCDAQEIYALLLLCIVLGL